MISKISAELLDAIKLQISQWFTDIKLALPFLLNLTPTERKRFRKMGTKRTGYVNQVHNALITNPSVYPASYNMAEFTKDKELYDNVAEVKGWNAELAEGLNDTLLVIGTDLMAHADAGYRLIKEAAKTNLALTTLADEIGKAFEGQGKEQDDEEEPQTPQP